MMRHLWIFIILSFSFFSCEEEFMHEVKFEFNIIHPQSGAWGVDEEEIQLQEHFNRADFMRALDIPKEATIKEVRLKDLTVNFTEHSPSTADSVFITISSSTEPLLRLLSGKRKLDHFGFDAKKPIKVKLIFSFEVRPIEKLNGHLQNMVFGNVPFALNLDVKAIPPNSKVVGALQCVVDVYVLYESCESVPLFIEGDGEC